MSNTNTGGPAFARPASPAHEYGFHKHQEGMTLRDYFAAKAMQAFAMDEAINKEAETAPDWYKMIATASYDMADAMLKAREEVKQLKEKEG